MKQLFTLLFIATSLLGIAQPPSEGKPPRVAHNLNEAVVLRDSVAINKFLKEGANINAVDRMGDSPMLLAALDANLPMMEFLVKKGAQVDFPRSKKGRTPLMVALAHFGGLKITRFLVEHGADVNAKADDGTTPLIIASAGAKKNVVEYLLSKGADATPASNNGMDALKWAENIKPETLDFARQCKDCVVDQPGVINILKGLKK